MRDTRISFYRREPVVGTDEGQNLLLNQHVWHRPSAVQLEPLPESVLWPQSSTRGSCRWLWGSCSAFRFVQLWCLQGAPQVALGQVIVPSSGVYCYKEACMPSKTNLCATILYIKEYMPILSGVFNWSMEELKPQWTGDLWLTLDLYWATYCKQTCFQEHICLLQIYDIMLV